MAKKGSSTAADHASALRLGQPATWLRPKGNVSRHELAVLLVLALLPLLVALIRMSAWPGVLDPGMAGSLIPSIGHDLNQMLSLQSVPAGDRDRVLYMLFLPTGAMLIALARLTLGLKVIGFRSILIAVGFQESGVVPSLILILVMVSIVVFVRPVLVRFRLPYYARVSVIMSLAVIVLLCAVMLAPWMRSEFLWGVAFFPVIVLGLLAEGIAKVLDRDSGLTAIWRTGMTIGIALLLAGIGQIPILREIALEFPELVLTQIVSVILISEFLDLRLFQDWDAKLSGVALPRLLSSPAALRIAVVRNRRRGGVIGSLGTPSRGGYRKRSVRRIAAGLRASGHSVKVLEGDMSLLPKLEGFIPPHPRTGEPGGLVLNLSHGIQGDAAQAHVPAMLEMAGVAYTGPTPLGIALALDRVAMTTLLRDAGVAAPESRVVAAGSHRESLSGIHDPVAVRARTRPDLRIAHDRGQLEEAVRELAAGREDVVIEPWAAGREFEVPVLGNAPSQCLPIVEVRPDGAGRECPASLDPLLARAVRDVALRAFEVCGCRDYACVNVRLPSSGRPEVVALEVVGVLAADAAFELSAAARGWSFDELVARIVSIARERYRSGPAASPEVAPSLERERQGRGRLVAG